MKFAKVFVRVIINSFMAEVPPYHIETSPLICSANEWTGFYMIRTSVMKELTLSFQNDNNKKETVKLEVSAKLGR